MALQLNNTKTYWQPNADVVRYVTDIIQSSTPGSPLTITISPVRLEDFSVITVTEESLAAIVTRAYLDALQIT
jgi:hypothetical protein